MVDERFIKSKSVLGCAWRNYDTYQTDMEQSAHCPGKLYLLKGVHIHYSS